MDWATRDVAELAARVEASLATERRGDLDYPGPTAARVNAARRAASASAAASAADAAAAAGRPLPAAPALDAWAHRQQRRASGADLLAPRPVHVPDAPPPWATVCYKVLAQLRGGLFSVYDGHTQYAVGQTLHQRAAPEHGGGLYVFRTLEDCLRRDAEVFPATAELRRAPRVVARCRAWERLREEEPVRYGHKTAFSFLRVEALLPYPELRPATAEAAAPGAEPLPRGRPGGAPLRPWEASLIRAQAQTLALEDELSALEGAAAARRGSLLPPAAPIGRIWAAAGSAFGSVSTSAASTPRGTATPAGSEGGFSVSSGGRTFSFY